jgi:hypothetical protein
MTIAELHGKLSPGRPMGASERMEDLLTSDVFGTMKYAGWDKGFIDWLLCAEKAPVYPSPKPINIYFDKQKIISIKYRFWPILPNKREPDLAMLIEFDSGNCLLVIIEAKYFSGTSDFDVEHIEEDIGLTGNQIADQVIGLRDMTAEELVKLFGESPTIMYSSRNRVFEKIHLFITIHSELPKTDYENSIEKVGDYWPVPSYWLSWEKLAENIKPNLAYDNSGLDFLIMDLFELLKRKQLIPFRGFRMEPFVLGNITPSFWNESYWTMPPFPIAKHKSFWNYRG